MRRPNGLVLWEGTSLYDNVTPIVVILTGIANASINRKTGDMLQTWVMHRDGNPYEIVRNKRDTAICGDCPFRAGNGCYVNTLHAPRAVHAGYKAGKYPPYDPTVHDRFIKDMPVRFGAYGDPAAVPLHVWENLATLASSYTGYTHGWRNRPDLAPYCVASVHNLQEALEAESLGFRYFRTLPTSDNTIAASMAIRGKEIVCPNVTRGVTCADCALCAGNRIAARNIVIAVHGWTAKKAAAVSA